MSKAEQAKQMVDQQRRNFLKWIAGAGIAGAIASRVPGIFQGRKDSLEELTGSAPDAQAYLDRFHSANPSETVEKIVLMPDSDYYAIASEFTESFSEFYVNGVRDQYIKSGKISSLQGLAAKLELNAHNKRTSSAAKEIAAQIENEINWQSTPEYKSRMKAAYAKRWQDKSPMKGRLQALADPAGREFWSIREYEDALRMSRGNLFYDVEHPNVEVPPVNSAKEQLKSTLRDYLGRFTNTGFMLLPTNQEATRFIAFVSPAIFRGDPLRAYEHDASPDVDGALRHAYAVAGKMAAQERMIDWTSAAVGEDLEINGLENIADRDLQLSEYGRRIYNARQNFIAYREGAVHTAAKGVSADIERGIYDPNGDAARKAIKAFSEAFAGHYLESGQYSSEDLASIVRDDFFIQGDEKKLSRFLESDPRWRRAVLAGHIENELRYKAWNREAMVIQTSESVGKTPKFNAYVFGTAFELRPGNEQGAHLTALVKEQYGSAIQFKNNLVQRR